MEKPSKRMASFLFMLARTPIRRKIFVFPTQKVHLGTFIAEYSPGDSNNWPTSGKKGFYQSWHFTSLE